MPKPHIIEIDLRSLEQIYNSLDPSPFHERDLDEKAERYIVGWARGARSSEAIQLVITLPGEIHRSEAALQIPDAIHNHFRYRAVQSGQDLQELFRIGRTSLAVGLLVLISCFGAINYLGLLTDQSGMAGILRESLLILGWVANWRPLEIFLYDWWPVRRNTLLLERLAAMPVEVRSSP
jgi:hypothetical protein